MSRWRDPGPWREVAGEPGPVTLVRHPQTGALARQFRLRVLSRVPGWITLQLGTGEPGAERVTHQLGTRIAEYGGAIYPCDLEVELRPADAPTGAALRYRVFEKLDEHVKVSHA